MCCAFAVAAVVVVVLQGVADVVVAAVACDVVESCDSCTNLGWRTLVPLMLT